MEPPWNITEIIVFEQNIVLFSYYYYYQKQFEKLCNIIERFIC